MTSQTTSRYSPNGDSPGTVGQRQLRLEEVEHSVTVTRGNRDSEPLEDVDREKLSVRADERRDDSIPVTTTSDQPTDP